MAKTIGIIIGAALVIYFIALRPYDDTDPPGERSGLAVYTDHRTGVQYLSTGRGGLTPRLNADGTIRIIKN